MPLASTSSLSDPSPTDHASPPHPPLPGLGPGPPNLLPVLDEAWRPRKVVLACSVQMKQAALALRAIIQTKCPGLTVETLELPDAYD